MSTCASPRPDDWDELQRAARAVHDASDRLLDAEIELLLSQGWYDQIFEKGTSMRATPMENKIAAASETKGPGGKCPHCGIARAACREIVDRGVRRGFYCAQKGLQEDTDNWIYPTPDPTLAKVDNDPEVLATALLEAEAQKAFDAVSGEWESTLGQLAAVRVKAFGDKGEFDPMSGGWRPTAAIRPLARQEQKLAPKVEELFRRRELAGEELGRAKMAARRAYDQARMANGLSVMPGNNPPPAGAIIPTNF